MADQSGRAGTPLPADSLESRCASHAPVTASCRFPAGTVFGDWRITAFIGRGGNGEVYCAEHVSLGTPAAVKVLTREDERAKTRFAREARLLSDLKSEAFPHFFAYGEANPPTQSSGAINRTVYIAMELLEPGELPKGDRAVAKFMLKVCEAVEELHDLGYLHRDIKPGNILWRNTCRPATADGRARSPVSPERSEPRKRSLEVCAPHPATAAVPVLADLGLVKEIKTADFGLRTPSLTVVDGRRAGVGTPGYGAPEQMERGEATVASDIHALGVLADACFGDKPPRAWKPIIERATSSIPERRYPDVESFMCAVRRRHWQRKAAICLSAIVTLCVVGYLCWTPMEEYIEWRTMGTDMETNRMENVVVWRYDSPSSEEKSSAQPVSLMGSPTIPLNRDKMHPAARAYFDRSFPTNKTWTRSMPTQIAIAETNNIKAVDISLGKKSLSFKNTIRLSPGREYWITGPGTLDADLFCPTTAVVRLRNCVLLNRTKRLYPESGIQYHLEGGAYLNFISVRKMPQGLRLNDFVEQYDSSSNQLRFGGPATVEELNEERDRETRLRLSFEKSPLLP